MLHKQKHKLRVTVRGQNVTYHGHVVIGPHLDDNMRSSFGGSSVKKPLREAPVLDIYRDKYGANDTWSNSTGNSTKDGEEQQH